MSLRLNFDVLHNPFVQYLVLLVAIGNFVLFLYYKNIICIGVFLISALFAASYTKNMVVILVVAMVLCNIICVSMGPTEGFETPPSSSPPPSASSSPPPSTSSSPPPPPPIIRFPPQIQDLIDRNSTANETVKTINDTTKDIKQMMIENRNRRARRDRD